MNANYVMLMHFVLRSSSFHKNKMFWLVMTASVVWWLEFLATDPEVPGSIPGDTRFSEK
jgi:hypothetical protein